MPDLIVERSRNLAIAVSLFNKLMSKNSVLSNQSTEETKSGMSSDNLVDLDVDSMNSIVDMFFLKAQDISSITSNLAGIFL